MAGAEEAGLIATILQSLDMKQRVQLTILLLSAMGSGQRALPRKG
jgi:hypothetical protein